MIPSTLDRECHHWNILLHGSRMSGVGGFHDEFNREQ
jgi:hypothetical protein